MPSEDAALLLDLFDDACAAEIDAQHAHPIAAMGKRARAARIHAALALIARLKEERDDLRCSVIAFGGPWAVQYAHDHGLPPGHLHAVHYDLLARAGARMDNFTRALAPPPAERK